MTDTLPRAASAAGPAAGPADPAVPTPPARPTSAFTDLDLLGVAELLPAAERARLGVLHDLLQAQVRRPSIAYWNREEFAADLLPVLAGAGLGGLQLEPVSALFRGLAHAEVARADLSLSTVIGVHNELVVGLVDALGSPEQRRELLPRLATMELLGAFALTEPEHGSDVAGGLATTARRDGSHWVLDGAKRWIGLATVADFAVVWARDVADAQVRAFLVETGRPGFRAELIRNKIGLRIMPNADVTLDGVRLPERNRLPGAVGFAAVNTVLRHSRAWVGWQAVGLQLAALDVARAYALDRRQFDRPLAGFQLVQHSLARMAGNTASSLGLMVQVARLQDAGSLEMAHAALVKATCTAHARETVALGRSLLGGNGMTTDYEMAKLFGDAEAMFTYEGTQEVNQLIVGRELTGVSAFV
ncbi:acyl-CoA dehydrogenase family protein [Georgenia sp. EYE_87]|uniref:acyl-CoA dehydrogenase family protein n=1 Tax=Georgenia sp. EYE_87 TaxID=2853448 RepID=UPI00200342C5|nr:acyl-CoA dehydrogenase family protein [Georgenia sp. EYE_87]MCK6210302.1 acyl-CoA dehydrogenase family protein [Georgenia sp. EYE_87]